MIKLVFTSINCRQIVEMMVGVSKKTEKPIKPRKQKKNQKNRAEKNRLKF